MARRKRKQTINIVTILPGIVVLGGLVLAINLVSQIPSAAIGGFILLGALFFVAVVTMRCRLKRRLTQKIIEAVSADINVLVRLRTQLLLLDDYGTPQPAPWHKKINLFFESKVAQRLTKNETALLNKNRGEWLELVDGRVRATADSNPAFDEFYPEMTGPEFEVFCAEELKRVGWDARVTKHRDQGVDVVAQKNGVRLVLQCKRYSQPVGNAAVQQIATAKTHERAHFGAVVSNNQYTVPAQQLAKTSRIALLHFSDLKRIDAIILDRV